jgi:hypothetical protein
MEDRSIGEMPPPAYFDHPAAEIPRLSAVADPWVTGEWH